MEWITAGAPEVQEQRGKWVVRQGGYDPTTGLRRVRQLGTFRTKREATAYRAEVLAGRAGTATETVAQFLQQVCHRATRFAPVARGVVSMTCPRYLA